MKSARFTKRGFRRSVFKLVSVVTLLLFSSQTVFALPSGQQVVNGQADFSTQGSSLTVTNSPNAIIQWQGFSIGQNEAVRFLQQSASSSVLNRVIGQDPSRILGLLQSNGRVFLVNPNGILFGQGARIDVNGLVASTLNLSNADFLAGKYNFTAGAMAGSIQNQGTITTPAGGKVYLIAPDVENSGLIQSPQGEVILAAGRSVQLVDPSRPEIAVVVSAPEDAAVNLGKILAESGQVGIYGGLISQQGTVSADRAVVGENGRIFFKASKDVTLDPGSVTSAQGGGKIEILGGMDNGTVAVNGALDASAPNGGDGGFIETSAAKVTIGDNAAINTFAPYGKTGTWLIDPTNYTIASTGGDITGAALGTQLGTANITIQTAAGGAEAGDIFVNDSVNWSSGNTLILSAHRNVLINDFLVIGSGGNLVLRADSAASGIGEVIFAYGDAMVDFTAGGTASIFYNPVGGYTAPTNYSVNFSGVTPAAYMLVNDINHLQDMNDNLAGVYALGKDIDATATSGWNSGKGFLPIADSGATPFSGTFDGDGHTITGLYINRPTLTNYVGLFGHSSGVVRNVGLVNGNITGNGFVGGLVGYNYNALAAASISNSYSTGAVSGNSEVGGLVGENRGSISNSYSAGTVTGTGNYFGGLVGMNYVGGAISNSYSTGAVTVTGDYVGGLVGYNGTGAISNSYSTGAVSGTGVNVGGLIGGYGGGAITNSFWDIQTSGQNDLFDGRGTGKTTADLMTQTTYTDSGWDFSASGTWWMSNMNTRPFLRSEYRTEITNAHQLQLMGMNATTLGATYTLAADLDLAELTQASGLWNTATGFVPVGTQAAPFAGTFDGLGHTITGLYINRGTGQSIGLFGYTSSSSSILNTGLINASILDGYHVGGLVGDNYGLIENSYSTGASGAIYGKSTVGGLVGWNWGTGTVRNSFSTLAVYGDNGVGGLVGVNSGGIIESHSTGEVSYRGALFYADNKLGGLVGDNAGTISNSYHTTGTVTGNLSNVGGLVGYNSNNITGITGSYNTAPVVGTSKVGGLAGYNSGKITESYNSNTGTVSGTGSDVGGLVGYNTGSITDSYNAGTVTGTGTYVGGLTGENYGGTILRSWNTGGVTGVNNVGGLVGDNYNLITDSYNEGMVVGDSSVGGLVGFQDSGSQTVSSYSTGAVSGNSEVGGLVGENYYGTVNKTYSTGTVSGNFAVGGLAGRNDGSIRNSYSTGSVTGTGTSPSRIGGLVGYYNTGGSFYPIENSYSTGQVSAAAGATAVGGLIGWNSDGAGIVNNSYWNKETSGRTTSGGGTGLTTTQMTALSSFSGWDFATIWDITPGTTYPYLQGQALPYPAPSGVTPPEQQVISGTVVGADAGKIVYFAVNGTLRHEMDTITTAGGVFTVELSENKVSSNQALLAYVVGDSGYKGATVYLASGGDITGLLISANTLTAKSAGGTMSNTTLGIAKGSLSSTDIPYFVVNSNLTLNSGFSFLTASGTSYSLNGNITTTGGSQTFNGPVALAATAVLTAIGGSITLTSPLTAGAYLLTLSGDSGVAVNGAVTSSSAITLESSNNIEIASPITAASLVLRADAEGDGTGTVNFTGSGSVAITGGGAASIFYNPPDGYGSPTNYAAYFTGVVPTAYMLVNDIGPEAPTSADRGLQAIQNNLSGTYALGSDIDASSTSGWNSGAGFTPLGNDNLANPAELFTGIFDGFGHTITGLYINRPSTNYVGMFGGSDGNAIFRNVGLVNVNITGGFQTGGLVAHTGGVISNAYTTGTVTGTSNTVGGLVGLSAGSTSDSYSTATVNGVTYVGGLMGANYGTASSITNSYSTGSVTGTSSVGGLSGWNEGTITGSHSTGAVRGNNTVGGLVGINWSVNSITNSYSTGAVTGTGANSYYIGGLVGDNPGTISGSFSTGAVSGTESVGGLAGHSDGTIENSYSTSPVTGTATVGGLVGQLGSEINPPPAIITNSYSTGLVIGTSDVGGLVGCIQSGSVNGSYWNTETSGQATSAGGGTGLTTAGMTTLSSFSGWDPGIWGITAGTTYPYLLWQPPGTYPAASGGIATNLIPPTTLGNSVAAGDTVVALQTVTDAIFSPDAVIPADPFASPEAAPGTGSQGAGGTAPSGTGSSPSGASGASGGTGSSTAGESVSSGTGETSTSAETASTSAQEEEIARRAAARQGGELKREVHPDDEKVQKYCN